MLSICSICYIYNTDKELTDGEMLSKRKGWVFFCKYASLTEIQALCICFLKFLNVTILMTIY